MRDSYFFDRDGNPLAGKIPLQVRFYGGGDPATVRGHANAALNAFLHGVRLSLADTHRKTVALPGGGEMTMWRSFGVTRVAINVAGGEQEDEFYGGIMVAPKRLPTGDQFLSGYVTQAAVNSKPEELVVYGEVGFSGVGAGRSGRPGLPNVAANDVTESIVIQIAKDKPIGATPVKDGTIKIWRANGRNAVGNDILLEYYGFQENRTLNKDEYLLQLNRRSGLFFLATQHVKSFPAFPALQQQVLALRSFRLNIKNFAGASTARGIAIIVHAGADPGFPGAAPGDGGYSLSVIDTRNASAVWTRLSRVAAPDTSLPDQPRMYMERFGDVYEEINEPGGATLIRCSGSGLHGQAAGFWVRVAPSLSGDVITGELVPSYYTMLPGEPEKDLISMSKEMIVREQRSPIPNSTGFSIGTYGSISMSASGTYNGGTDPYVAGTPTPPPIVTAEWSCQILDQYDPMEFTGTLASGRKGTQRVKSEITSTYKWSLRGVEQPTIALASILEREIEWPSNSFFADTAMWYQERPITVTPVKIGYSGSGVEITHTAGSPNNKIQIKRAASVSATPEMAQLTYYGQYAFEQARLSTISAGPTGIEYGEMFYSMTLTDSSGNMKFEWPDLYALFQVAKPASALPETKDSRRHTRLIGPPILNRMLARGQPTDPSGNLSNGITYYEYYPELRSSYPGQFIAAVFPGATTDDKFFEDQTVSASYSGERYSQGFTAEQMASAYPLSIYADPSPPGGLPAGSESGITVRLETPKPTFQGGRDSHHRANVTPRKTVFVEDPRTGGFVFSMWLGFSANETSLFANAHVSLIGNRFGAVPLQQVIEEWRALGQTNADSDDQVVWLEGGPAGLV